MDETRLNDLIDYYLDQGAPQDQQMLIGLLREVQELDNGSLSSETIDRLACACQVQPSMLGALIRRIPSLRTASAPHRLEMCRTCQKNAALAAFVQREYGAVPGGNSSKGGFTLSIVNCMKNCKAGPSIRWDGVLYPRADEELIRNLVGNLPKS